MANVWFTTTPQNYCMETETVTGAYSIRLQKNGTVERRMNYVIVKAFSNRAQAAKQLEAAFAANLPKMQEMWQLQQQVDELSRRWCELREDVGDNTNVKG